MTQVRADLAPDDVLVASINLGNPVLAQGTSAHPAGVTVDIAREAARRLDVAVEFRCFDAARHSFEALVNDDARLGFLAIEPARAEQVQFTAPYALIEGVYVVPDTSPVRTISEADAAGNRVGVKEGSAYDLYLTRTLQHAQIVRGAEGTDTYVEHGLEVGAGIRQPVSAFVEQHPGHRLIDEPFMQIRQAAAIGRDRSPETLRWLHDLVEDLKASCFIADSLARSGQGGVTVAPAE